ncbi:cytochrome c [Flammeovirgaceae bacterium SG7u.111]|nr:cytochrome c [Flammeovirgaceae bacterium SG7u.132]WPO36674.1 cytochrome c [Flammeovirgaceae bacterium SG7u.111]
MKILGKKNIFFAVIISTVIIGCKADGDNPGVEYAPQMYHSIPYEPLSQITEEGIPDGIISSSYYLTNSLPYNDYKGEKSMNVLKPVEGTVARQNFTSVSGSNVPEKGQELLVYKLHKDSVDLAGRILKNPVPNTEDIVAEGKQLYLSYCSPCHGATGTGDGKVGAVYKGVPNYSAGRYSTLPEGHIFHVITHGKGRMWAHKSQLNPEERWKVVRYVQKLQKGEK